MIEKLDRTLKQERDSGFTISEAVSIGEMQEKINELCDAVNRLETMAKNTNTVLESLVEENNIHEKQIDELQMKVEPEKCETPAENVQLDAESRPENVQQISYIAPGDITVFYGFNCSVEFDTPLPYGTRITIKTITKGE